MTADAHDEASRTEQGQRRARLVKRRFLDPRPRKEALKRPILGAVNIPITEIPSRTSELPPRWETVFVAGCDELGQETIALLVGLGRSADRALSFEFGTPPKDEIGRLWEPNAFLAQVLGELAPASALDLACGVGRDVVFMAGCGWDVMAIDALPDALTRGQALEDTCGAAFSPIQWLRADLEHSGFRPDREFDLVTGFRFLHRPLMGRLAAWLNSGGHLIYETFTKAHRERHGRPARDAFVLGEGELPDLLPGLEVLHYSEDWREGGAHTARFWGRRTKQAEPV